jgi:hypothetical protein
MRRLNLVELHEQPWFPKSLRDAVTDVLQLLLNRSRYHELVGPLLRVALHRARASHVVDLCSGGGGPWLELIELVGSDRAISVCLTDKFPNSKTFRRMETASQGKIKFVSEGVDARHVPPKFCGFRTLFNSFHHFDPERAKAILQDAVQRREGVAIFEVPRRTFATLCATLLMGLGTFVVVPIIRPFRPSLFVWTYLIPVLPAVMWIDGMVSRLRVYAPSELRELCDLPTLHSYAWIAGIIRKRHSLLTVTYLVGYPLEPGSAEPPTMAKLRPF